MYPEQCKAVATWNSWLHCLFCKRSAISKDKSKKHQRGRGDSESDYEPWQDDSVEPDLVDDDISKVITLPSYQGPSWFLFGKYNYLQTLSNNVCFPLYQGSKGNIGRKTNNQTSDAPPSGVRFRTHKRVYVENLPTKAPRSKRINSQPDASLTLTPSGNHVPPPSHPDVSQQVDRPAGTGLFYYRVSHYITFD